MFETATFNEFFKFRSISSISYNIEFYFFFFQKFSHFCQLMIALGMTNITGIYYLKITTWGSEAYFFIIECIRQEKYRFSGCHIHYIPSEPFIITDNFVSFVIHPLLSKFQNPPKALYSQLFNILYTVRPPVPDFPIVCHRVDLFLKKECSPRKKYICGSNINDVEFFLITFDKM